MLFNGYVNVYECGFKSRVYDLLSWAGNNKAMCQSKPHPRNGSPQSSMRSCVCPCLGTYYVQSGMGFGNKPVIPTARPKTLAELRQAHQEAVRKAADIKTAQVSLQIAQDFRSRNDDMMDAMLYGTRMNPPIFDEMARFPSNKVSEILEKITDRSLRDSPLTQLQERKTMRFKYKKLLELVKVLNKNVDGEEEIDLDIRYTGTLDVKTIDGRIDLHLSTEKLEVNKHSKKVTSFVEKAPKA